jgi:hypothetical protein
MSRIVFIGRIGSDAGGWYIGADGKIHRIPGWNPEQLEDVAHLANAVRAVAQVRTPGAEGATAALQQALVKGLAGQVKEGDVVVFG